MNSEEARTLINGNWYSWRSLEPANLFRIPDEYGVYLIRTDHKISRLLGTSDILYVGEGILSSRIGNVFAYNRGMRSWPYYSGVICTIRKELRITMEFSYLKTSDKATCEQAETRILDEYERQHLELTPVNHSRGKGSKIEY